MIKRNFSFRKNLNKYTVDDLKKEVNECLELAKEAGVNFENSVIVDINISNKMKTSFGLCKKILKSNYKKYNVSESKIAFIISISKFALLNASDDIMHDVIMH